MRKVGVLPYQSDWKCLFEEERKNLKSIFVGEILNIFHIGSTAIPAIMAKPVIDILVEVREINNVDDFNKDMEELTYEALGEYGIPGRRFFRKGGDNRTHHVHIFEQGSEEISRHLGFRDYLLAHPEEAMQYSQLKEGLAEKFPYCIEKYCDGKDYFIKEIVRKAEMWRKTQK